MKRLRHPIRAIREPFGTAGLIVACVALIAALGGTALAAKGALTGKQKKEVTNIAKKFAGKPGAAGAAGPAGPQGPAGAAGKDGAKGDKGDPGSPGAPGSPGTPGATGKSVESVTIDPGETECEGQGGAEYIIEGESEGTEICNGKNGSPWAAGGTLPAGATETGVYAQQTSPESGGFGIWVPISFPIPLDGDTAAAAQANVKYGPPKVVEPSVEEEEEEFSAACHGTGALPEADPGYLCIYRNESLAEYNTSFEGVVNGPNSTAELIDSGGTFLSFAPNQEPELAIVAGSFAITGCSASLPPGDPDKCP